MPNANPLVAAPQETTTAVTGIGIAESCVDIAHGVSGGDWVEAGLGVLGAGLEVLSMVIDPLGTLASYGVSWLIEHVRPLKEALDWFAGDPPVIRSFSQTWGTVAAEVNTVAQDFLTEATSGTAGWTGAAGDAYRGHATEAADALAGAGTLADGISVGVMIMGEVVAFVREFIRDLVGELVGRLIAWALEAAATLGLATPLVVAQATAAISKVVNKVADVVRKLVKTLGNVAPRIRKIIDKLDEIIQKLSTLTRKADGSTTPSASTSAARRADDAPTPHSPEGTSSSHTPDTDTPSSTRTDGSSGRTDGASARDNADDPRRTGQDDRSTCVNGDPINVYTGEVVLPQTDLELAGVLPLVLRRRHMSGYRLGRLFGASWASTVDQRLEIESDGVYLVAEDGRILVYPAAPTAGHPVLPIEGPRWTLTRTTDGDYLVAQPETGQTLHFSGSGTVLPLSAIVSRHGHRIDLSYTGGMLTEISHSGGYQVAVTTANGLITELVLRGPQDTSLLRYHYDGKRRLTEVINSSRGALRFDYDHAGRVVRWEDRNGEWYRFHFDGQGRCVRTEGSGGALTGSLEIDQERRNSVWTNALGHATTYHFNELNQIVREVDPLGNATLSEWDRYDRLLARTDPLGRTTRYTYDDAGNLTALTRADRSQQRFEFNELGLPVTIIDPDGAVWRREYDSVGSLLATTDPMGAVTRYSYDGSGNLAGVTDPLGGVHRISTNAAGLPVAVSDPLGATTRYDRDQFGRISAITDPLGAVTRFSWTVEGLLLSRTRPDGSTERWLHDGEGNHTEHIDALGQRTRVEYTHFDLPLVVTAPDGTRVEYTYDSQLRLIAVTNQQGMTWHYEYDPAGNLVAETDFSGRQLRYAYDAAGQVIARTNGAGQHTRMTWDELGNLVDRRSDDGTFATFAYDQAGRLQRAVNVDAEVVFQHDPMGRVLTETVNGRTVTTTYDMLGRCTSRRTPTGAQSVWSYDAAGNPAALRTAGQAIQFGYDAVGRELERLTGTGAVLTQSWDVNHRLTTQTLSARAGPQQTRPVNHRKFTYRPDDYLTSVEDEVDGIRRFELDLAGRVVGVHGPRTESYRYDAAGNLVDAGAPAGSGNIRCQYDRQGRMILRQRKRPSAKPDNWHFSWDAEDRLTQIVTPDGTRWRYRYDALGRRICKQRFAPGDERMVEQTDFSWDGTLLAEQVHSAGRATTWNWTPDGFRPVSQTERVRAIDAPQQWIDQEFYSIVTDIVGTPTELVDTAGNVSWHARHSLWGEVLSGPTGRAYTPLRFPGQYHDLESGLNYNYHRYYLPELARYASPDPLGLVPSPNPQSYVPNPLSWLDPLGLAACRDCNARTDDLPRGDNRWYDSRRQAFNAARDRAGVPHSAQPVRQWTVGDDVTRRGMANYHYDPNPGAHGRYYQYDTPNGPRVVAEHTSDPRAPHPHFHAYQPKEGATGINIGEKYARVDGGPHHYYHSGHNPNWTP
jgi:RHS repeat-associated protein